MLPDNFPVTGQPLRNWLNTAGQGLILSFDKASHALDFIRGAGIAIRTSDFYAIYNSVHQRFNQSATLYDLPGNTLIPIALTDTTHNYNLSTNFLYRFNVIGTDPHTGDPVNRFMAVGSNRQLTSNEAAEALDNLISGEEAHYNIESMSYVLDGALARPGLW
jgi:hypothetical protein